MLTYEQASDKIIIALDCSRERAFELAEGRRSVVLLLAKGHETRQHTRDGYVPCTSDCVLARRGVEEHDRAHPVER